MAVKQRKGASGASAETPRPSDSKRRAKDAESRSVKRVAQIFFLCVMLAFSVAGLLYARGYAKHAQIAAKETKQLGAVHAHPAFQANPFAAIQEHLRNMQASTSEERDSKKGPPARRRK